jgi:hypothetical protein
MNACKYKYFILRLLGGSLSIAQKTKTISSDFSVQTDAQSNFSGI